MGPLQGGPREGVEDPAATAALEVHQGRAMAAVNPQVLPLCAARARQAVRMEQCDEFGVAGVLVHDFMDKDLGKAIPYGVYDLTANQGWVSVGIDHDTARFAVEAIHRWWRKMGSRCHRGARELLITADGGGSNGSRCRLWKVALQGLADRLGMPIHVCHLPPGTSKWNKIEHRMFCHITQNWRGRPLVSHEVIIGLIANTATAQGLRICAELDTASYPTGVKVTDDELAAVRLKRDAFHGDWNYCVLPIRPKK